MEARIKMEIKVTEIKIILIAIVPLVIIVVRIEDVVCCRGRGGCSVLVYRDWQKIGREQ